MGLIFGQDEWEGEITRIYVRYGHPDPDWEHDPDIAPVLQSMRGAGGRYRIAGVHRITHGTPPGYYDIVIARQIDD
jgi:hypothetical protein